MEHLSADRIAELGVDPSEAPTSQEEEHLAGCRACGDDLAELRHLANEVRAAQPVVLRPPHPDVWAAVDREVRAPEPVPAIPAVRRRRSVLVAAAAGLVVGVGGTLGLQLLDADRRGEGGPSAAVASVVLSALPGQSGEGTAELVRAQDSLMLHVHAALQPPAGTDYYEVWLLNTDGRRMYALGALPPAGDADYWLPTPRDAPLSGYTVVDISLEPDDGDTAHSQHSLVRGDLPG